jgi:hypothetical protein
MWHLIAWSLQWLYRGIHPDKDWDDNVWPVGSSQRLLGENKEPLAGFFFPCMGLAARSRLEPKVLQNEEL